MEPALAAQIQGKMGDARGGHVLEGTRDDETDTEIVGDTRQRT